MPRAPRPTVARTAAHPAPLNLPPPPRILDIPPPKLLLLALEFRAFWEFGALLPTLPLLGRAPPGDGHPVVVFPGLSAGDVTTLPLRRYLDSLGYATHGWEQGLNLGPRPGVIDAAKAHVVRIHRASGQPVSLIGWSLGGVYAREFAKELHLAAPGMVRSVITLGTPFGAAHTSTNAWKLYELASGRNIEAEMQGYDLPTAPTVPTTSIYSRSDGIVAWQGSVQAPGTSAAPSENIEVMASHFGIGLNPLAWWAVADRLAQAPGQWQSFERKSRLLRAVFPAPAA
ncbi:MAG: esterase/lipase family protein [Burkholderiaceae bacterium]